MWAEKDEIKYQHLLTTIKSNPSQPLTNEVDIIILDLFSAYLQNPSVVFYKKICAFYSIFLDDLFHNNNNASSQEKLNLLETISSKYPVVHWVKQHINELHHKAIDEVEYALAVFVKAAKEHGIDLSLDTNFYYMIDCNFLYLPINKKPSNLENIVLLPCEEMSFDESIRKAATNKITIQIQEKLIQAHQQLIFIKALQAIQEIYEGKLISAKYLSHACHNPVYGRITTYQDVTFSDIYPNKHFNSLINSYFEQLSNEWEKETFIPFLAPLIVESDSFKNWKVYPKFSGGEAGFILASPDQQRNAFVKYTSNVLLEILCAKMLIHLGIKMPETQLLNIQGISLFLTWNLSRTYSKNSIIKEKKFNLESEVYDLAFSKDHKMRISYAKFAITAFLFGLEDLGPGNLGILETKTNTKTYSKVGIVDYFFEYKKKKIAFTNFTELRTLLKHFGFAMPLTDDEFKTACSQLMNPKQYTYAQPYLLFSQKSDPSYSYIDAIEKAYAEMQKEVGQLSLANKEQLEAAKEIVKTNLIQFFACIAQINSQPSPPATTCSSYKS